jgi:uncharacterized membrane protein
MLQCRGFGNTFAVKRPALAYSKKGVDTMNRPNLSIPKTKMEVSHEIISVVAILASIVYLWMEWPKLPAIVPIHFNGCGEVDGGGG